MARTISRKRKAKSYPPFYYPGTLLPSGLNSRVCNCFSVLGCDCDRIALKIAKKRLANPDYDSDSTVTLTDTSEDEKIFLSNSLKSMIDQLITKRLRRSKRKIRKTEKIFNKDFIY